MNTTFIARGITKLTMTFKWHDASNVTYSLGAMDDVRKEYKTTEIAYSACRPDRCNPDRGRRLGCIPCRGSLGKCKQCQARRVPLLDGPDPGCHVPAARARQRHHRPGRTERHNDDLGTGSAGQDRIRPVRYR